jgi:FkbM family methyltransferase
MLKDCLKKFQDCLRRQSLIKILQFIGLFTSMAYAQDVHFYSQYQQDQYVYERFFKNKRNGVFVDIGAHDGITLSNTYFFEKNMEWTGICVEPIPEIFARLKNNRTCLCIEGCIFDDLDKVSFLKISGWAEMLSGIVQNYDPLHVKRIESEIALNGGHTQVIEVKCYNLTHLLLDNQIQHVDYLSIDTEGGEFGILRSIDFTKLDIDIIEVENNYHEPFEEFLAAAGYKKVCCLGPDEIYERIK